MSKTYLLTLLFSLFQHVCSAQSASDILNRYYNAIGGETHLKTTSTAVLIGSSSTEFMNYEFRNTIKRDYIRRYENTFSNGRTTAQCYNGIKYNRIINGVASTPIVRPIQADKFLLFSDLIFANPDSIVKLNDFTLTYTDRERLVFYTFIFEPDSDLLVEEIKSHQSIEAHTYYSNYKSVGGLLFPFNIRKETPYSTYITNYTEIILNPDLPDSIFDCKPE